MLAMSTPQAIAVRLTTALLALVALSQSYHALVTRAAGWLGARALAEWNPEPLAWTYPLSVDGLILVGMVGAAVLAREHDLWRKFYPWGVLALGLAVSLLGNAPPGLIPGDVFVLRVFPPVSLALALHLTIVLSQKERKVRAPRQPVERSPEPIQPLVTPNLEVVAELPASNSARARELIAAARESESKPDVKAIALACELSESSVRRLLAEHPNGRARSLVSG